MIMDAEVALTRANKGQGRSTLFLGLRGVGKTVLLIKISQMAEAAGAVCITLEAPEEQPLAEMLVPPLRKALFRLSASAKAGQVAKEGLALGKTVKNVAPLRDGLIKKGMVYSPQHGDTAFTVPMFDEFMKRVGR